MVGALEQSDLVAAGVRPRAAKCDHHRFGAGIVEHDLLDAADPFTQQFRKFVFLRAGRRVRRAARQLVFDCGVDARMRVSVYLRRVVIVEIDPSIVVEIRSIHAFGMSEVERKGWVLQQRTRGAGGHVFARP